MDEHMAFVEAERIKRTMKALCENGFPTQVAKTREEARALTLSMIEKGSVVSHGGSLTLSQCGIPEALTKGEYNYLDRSLLMGEPEKLQRLYRDCFSADWYLGSSNAVTEQGELYNIDGNGNRVAAYIFGPKNVLIIAGVNKIVSNIQEAEQRLKTIAAPANTHRLERNTPCQKLGVCVDCRSGERICCDYVVQRFQRVPNRVKVILVAEALGY